MLDVLKSIVVKRRARSINGKIFTIINNDEKRVVEIWGKKPEPLETIRYNSKCERKTESALRKLSEVEEEEFA